MDLRAKEVVFEKELNEKLEYKRTTPNFHTFMGNKFRTGLKFTSENEARKFAEAVENSLSFTKHSTLKKLPSQHPSSVNEKVRMVDCKSVDMHSSSNILRRLESRQKSQKGIITTKI